MKYEISQKLFSFGDDFSIRDEHKRECFYVDGKAMSLGKSLSFQDENKNEKASIRQKLFAFSPTYEISRNGQKIASIKKRLFTMRPQFTIDVAGTNNYEIIGDFIGHEYTVKRDSRQVARVSKHFFAFGDSYGVDIESGDAVLILSAVVVVDLVLHKLRKTPH